MTSDAIEPTPDRAESLNVSPVTAAEQLSVAGQLGEATRLLANLADENARLKEERDEARGRLAEETVTLQAVVKQRDAAEVRYRQLADAAEKLAARMHAADPLNRRADRVWARELREAIAATASTDTPTPSPSVPFVEHERVVLEVIDERDRYYGTADDLASAISRLTGVDIGEHSSGNDPWRNALTAAETGIWSGVAARLRALDTDPTQTEKERRALAQTHKDDFDVESAVPVAPKRLGQMVSVRLDPDVAIAMRDLAIERGTSMSDLLREGAAVVLADGDLCPPLAATPDPTTHGEQP